MRVLVLGIGKMGAVIIRDLIESEDVVEIVAADLDVRRVQRYIELLGDKRLRAQKVDATNYSSLISLMERGFDVIISSLNYVALGPVVRMNVIKAAIEAEVNYIDLVSPNLDVLSLDETAKKANVTIIPGIGVDPGIDLFCVGYGVSKLDKVKKINIYCGGFPQKNTPGYRNPFHYKITFAWNSVVKAVHGKAKVLLNGNIVEVNKLENPEKIFFPEPIGECEAWFSGARLELIDLLNLQDIEELWSKTVRWPGYCEMWRKFIDLHLTDEEPLIVKGYKISPRDFIVAWGNKYLQYERGEGDLVVLRVIVSGEKNNTELVYQYDLIDFYDEENDITAMARCTAYPCSIIAQMIGRGEVRVKGVIHPVKLGLSNEIFKKIVEELEKRGIFIKETITRPVIRSW